MYWDEDNRLVVLSDNGRTSRYTYNAAGERIVKSPGDVEGVYANGAPQGITLGYPRLQAAPQQNKRACSALGLHRNPTKRKRIPPIPHRLSL